MHLTSLVALFAGCGCETDKPPPGDPDGGTTCPDASFLGDPELPPQVEPIAIQLDGTFVPIEDGDPIMLFTPLQGGQVILAGALLTNVALEDCGRLRIGALFRDPTDPLETAFKNAEATVRYRPMEGRPGWAEPILVNDRRNMAPNLEVCGFGAYPRDSDACEWILDVRFEDARTEDVLATERRRIVPTCPEDDPGEPEGIAPEIELENCQCQCTANYAKGRCTPESVAAWVDPSDQCE